MDKQVDRSRWKLIRAIIVDGAVLMIVLGVATGSAVAVVIGIAVIVAAC